MDNIHDLLCRQNENLKRLEVALTNAMSRIESIERLYMENDQRNGKSEKSLITSKEEYCNSLFEPLTSPNNLSSADKKALEIDRISLKLENISNNELNDNKDLKNRIKQDEYNNLDLNEDEYKMLQNDISLKIKDNSKYLEFFSEKENLEYNQFKAGLKNKSSNIVKTTSDKNIDVNSASTIPNTPISTEEKVFKDEIGSTNVPNTRAFERNNSNKYSGSTELHKNGLEINDERIYPNEVVKITALKLENLSDCFAATSNNFLSECLRKINLDETSNKHYLFDEEENSNSKQDPLDLENEENEFYYLKAQVKRGSITYREHSNKNMLEVDHKIKYRNSPLSARMPRRRFYGEDYFLNTQRSKFQNSRARIKEIRYHKPHEKIVGYIQIPYHAFVGPSPSNKSSSNLNEGNGTKRKINEKSSLDEKTDSYGLLNRKIINSHSIFVNLSSSSYSNSYFVPNNRFIVPINKTKIYPMFHRFNRHNIYPLFLIRPYYREYISNVNNHL